MIVSLFFISSNMRKFSHVLIFFLLVNLVTFPITSVVALWFWEGLGSHTDQLAECIPILLEPVIFISVFKYLVKKDSMEVVMKDRRVWKMIIIANLVTFLIGLMGMTILMNI